MKFSVGLPACCLKIKSPGSHGHDEERYTRHNGYERSMFHNSNVLIFTGGCNMQVRIMSPDYELLHES